MKKMKIFTVLTLALFVGGCASFGDEEQYKEGDWWGAASPETVARIKSDKLALAKLAAEPVQGDAVQGYEGIAANFSRYRRNFVFFGPETKAFLLDPGEKTKEKLVPGRYECVVMNGSATVGTWRFPVGPQRSTFLGEKTHWFVYTEK